jgi:hypothetical protein
MIYSLETLRLRQRRYYAALQELDDEELGLLRPVASGPSDPRVTITKVLHVGSRLEYTTHLAYLLPDPGYPADLEIHADPTFPQHLMELRMDWPDDAPMHVLSFTYPFTRGPVDVAPLLSRPAAGSTHLDGARAELAALLDPQAASPSAVLAFLREQPTDLWRTTRRTPRRVARLAPTGETGAPVVIGAAVGAARRIADALAPRSTGKVHRYTTIALCEDPAAAHNLLYNARALEDLHRSAVGKLGRETAHDLRHAAALWALAGPPLRPERDPEHLFGAVLGLSVEERAARHFRIFQARLLGEQVVAAAGVVDPKQIPADAVLDMVDECLQQLATSDAPNFASIAELETDLRPDPITARRAIIEAAAYLVAGHESERAGKMLERSASNSQDLVVRWYCKVILCCLPNE